MDNVKRECKVVILTTNERTDLQLNVIHKILRYKDVKMAEIPSQPYQHLYIISDDESKESDWCVNISKGIVYQKDDLPMDNMWKKIIATTDLYISPASLQAIIPKPSQQFIEKYVEEYNKGNVIDRVMVEYDIDISKSPYTSSKMNRVLKVMLKSLGDKLIPKINPKDNTITISKIKDSWNREEVINLLYKHTEELLSDNKKSLEDWIEENL